MTDFLRNLAERSAGLWTIPPVRPRFNPSFTLGLGRASAVAVPDTVAVPAVSAVDVSVQRKERQAPSAQPPATAIASRGAESHGAMADRPIQDPAQSSAMNVPPFTARSVDSRRYDRPAPLAGNDAPRAFDTNAASPTRESETRPFKKEGPESTLSAVPRKVLSAADVVQEYTPAARQFVTHPVDESVQGRTTYPRAAPIKTPITTPQATVDVTPTEQAHVRGAAEMGPLRGVVQEPIAETPRLTPRPSLEERASAMPLERQSERANATRSEAMPAQESTVQVHIGRIEVRAEPATQAEDINVKPSIAPDGFDSYAALRNYARWEF